MNEVIEYFKQKADKYDLVDDQIYWVLSDKLLWATLLEKVLNHLSESFTFLDAGGGTGRWALKILEHFPTAQGYIVDLSEAMTAEALKKAEKLGLKERLTVVNGNLNEVTHLLEKSGCPATYHLIFNFHNVLGFVDDPQKIINDLSLHLMLNGTFVSFLPNKYHTIYFNIAHNAIDEAEYMVKKHKGRFTNTMPYMHVFTPKWVKELYHHANLSMDCLTGFPNFIYPGFQETQLEGSTTSVESILRQHFDAIYAIEKSMIGVEEIVGRANNLLAIGKRLSGE